MLTKIKPAILVIQIFVLAILVGCRAQMSNDRERYEAEISALKEAHIIEMEELRKQAEDGLDTRAMRGKSHSGWTALMSATR